MAISTKVTRVRIGGETAAPVRHACADSGALRGGDAVHFLDAPTVSVCPRVNRRDTK